MLVVIISSIMMGIFFPGFSRLFASFPIYCMMGLLLISFLSIPFTQVFRFVRDSGSRIFYILIFKLILLPCVVFLLFRWFLPSYALAALLLSAASTGVVAPFFAELLSANGPLVVITVVSGSLLMPVTLPALVKILASRTVVIPFSAMAQILGAVVFIPFAFTELLRRCAPGVAEKVIAKRFPLSLALFAMTNFGIFSKYASYFRRQPSTVLVALLVAVCLAGIYFGAGLLFSWRMSLPEQLSMIISTGMMNNVLVLVFSSQFFGPTEPTVAAVYTFPFFCFILPLRVFRSWRLRGIEKISSVPVNTL